MTSFSISFVFKGREFRSCYGINFLRVCISLLKNRIFEPKSMEPHQPYLSFLFRNFLNKP